MKIVGVVVLVIALYGSSSVSALDSDARQAALDSHNSRRSNLAQGNEPAYGGGNMPSGRNIYKLSYSEELEGYAQSWSDGCQFEHSPSDHRPNAGENIYMSSANEDPVDAINNAAQLFWQENVEYGTPADLNLTLAAFNKGIGHFTQMAWGATTQVGCGVTWCPDTPMTFVVCNYRIPGNWLNELIYEKGEPCQEDSDCTTYPDSTCSATEGLCLVADQDVGSGDTTTSQPEESSPSSSGPSSTGSSEESSTGEPETPSSNPSEAPSSEPSSASQSAESTTEQPIRTTRGCRS